MTWEGAFLQVSEILCRCLSWNWNYKADRNLSRNKNRKAIWFNPPYSFSAKINIGKVFLKLVKEHLPRLHKFNKIFYLNKIKISYRLMPNLKNLIKQHNSKILSKDQDKIQRSCNGRINETCPQNGECLLQCIVYIAEVTTNTTYKEDCGKSDGAFKFTYNNQTHSFRHIYKYPILSIPLYYIYNINLILSHTNP